MNWPERPAYHDWELRLDDSYQLQISWRDPEPEREPQGMPFRTCGHCGSIHPEDLVRLLDEGAQLVGSDWKYGWPHKFYVQHIPNPLAGKIVAVGSRSGMRDGIRFREPIMGKASEFTSGKWYNSHLYDLDAEAFAKVAHVIHHSANIIFQINEGRLQYFAPHYNYQAG